MSKTSLVMQTRVGWCLIGILLVATLALSAIGLSSVQDTQRKLGKNAIPTLHHVEAVRTETENLELAFASLVAATNVDSRTVAQDQANASFEMLLGLSQDDDQVLRWLDEIYLSFAAVEDATAKVLAIRSDIQKLQSKIVEQEQILEEKISTYGIEKGIAIESIVLESTGQADISALAERLFDLNQVSQIEALIDRQHDLIVSLYGVQTEIRLAEIEERISFNLRSATRSLISLPNLEQRQSLARTIKDLREVILGASGLISLEATRIELEENLRQDSATAFALLERISKSASAGVTEARLGISQAAAAIDETINRTIFWLSLFSIGTIGMIIAVTVLFFERKVIGRLRSLTQAVRAISSGNTDWEVAVEGTDEFGEMGQALDQFKITLVELQRSNDELERFASAASHDLRSPLRAIHDLALWTIEDAGDQLPKSCDKNLLLIVNRAERLSNLLNALLDYALAGRQNQAVSVIDLSELAEDVFELMGVTSKFNLTITGEVSSAKTYVAPLRQILLNFIANSIKHHDQGAGVITLNFGCNGNRLEVSVTDDGPGIEPMFHDRIFGLFQTLKSRDIVEGSGMGLSIIRKQVERYNGHVSVVSDPAISRGTTFIFDWPILDQAKPQRPALVA